MKERVAGNALELWTLPAAIILCLHYNIRASYNFDVQEKKKKNEIRPNYGQISQ
jgi:hypothetical protein